MVIGASGGLEVKSKEAPSLIKSLFKRIFGGTSRVESVEKSAVKWGMWSDLRKAAYKGREYAEINGRYYTREAVDRMTPRFFGKAAGGYEARGIPTSVVEDVIKHGMPRPEIRNNELRIVFEHNGVQVVTAENEKVIITVRKH